MSQLNAIFSMLRLLPLVLRPARSSDLEELKKLIRASFPDVEPLTTSELSQWLADPNRPAPVLLDVRSAGEFATSHLKGAIHATSISELSETLSRHTPLVLYCSVGYRAAQFGQKLQSHGFINIRNLEGAIFQWAKEGRELYRGTQIVNEVHPHSRKWRPLLKRSLNPVSPP